MKPRFVLMFGLLSAIVAAENDNAPDQVELDPKTKQALSRDSAELVIHPDGTRDLVLNGGHRHVFMARIREDGSVETVCVDNEAHARAFLSQGKRADGNDS